MKAEREKQKAFSNRLDISQLLRTWRQKCVRKSATWSVMRTFRAGPFSTSGLHAISRLQVGEWTFPKCPSEIFN
jgi:hypothetical protein